MPPRPKVSTSTPDRLGPVHMRTGASGKDVSGPVHKPGIPARQVSPSPSNETNQDDGYISMNWSDESGLKRTTDMLDYIIEHQYVRRALYARPGEDSTSMKHTQVHLQIADHLLKHDPVYSPAYPRLQNKYGRAVKARLHKLNEVYMQKRALLAKTGAGLSDSDRIKYPDVQNLQELVRKQFPWYDRMDEFLHERATLGLDALVNSDDPADLSVVGWGGMGRITASRGGDSGAQAGDGEDAGTLDLTGGEDKEMQGENIPRTRTSRSSVIDMAPIGEAIREGDVLREASLKERITIMTRAREEEKRLDRDAKERKAAADREFKLKREEMRLRYASEKKLLELKSKEVEKAIIEARIKEAQVQLGGTPTQAMTNNPTAGQSEGANAAGETEGRGARNLKRIWE